LFAAKKRNFYGDSQKTEFFYGSQKTEFLCAKKWELDFSQKYDFSFRFFNRSRRIAKRPTVSFSIELVKSRRTAKSSSKSKEYSYGTDCFGQLSSYSNDLHYFWANLFFDEFSYFLKGSHHDFFEFQILGKNLIYFGVFNRKLIQIKGSTAMGPTVLDSFLRTLTIYITSGQIYFLTNFHIFIGITSSIFAKIGQKIKFSGLNAQSIGIYYLG